MPLLDSVLHAPDRTGPTRDYKAIAAQEPVFRQEAFQMRPGRRPISLNASLRPRPQHRSGNAQTNNLRIGTTPILIRHSNQRPAEAGEGAASSTWSISNPNAYAMLPGMGGLGTGVAIASALALGIGALLLLRR